ncbi:P-loop containing nucleoside triphosphate hydrolase protein [Cyathus striatus]|nr:P-loop containing nucleoside triphosphate hydrolase protein [Cyathus striatus]
MNQTTNQDKIETLSPIQNIPPSATQNFTGQDEYLERLHNHFDKNDAVGRKMFLLYGMGGIGKTQICLKFKDEVSDHYHHIFWIDATSKDTIEQSIKDIHKINVKIIGSENSYSAIKILQWISTLQKEWLIIFDNADGSPELIEKYLPPSGNRGNILITSRNSEHKRIVSPMNSMEVSEMSRDTAIELLLKASGLNETPQKYYGVAEQICTKFYFLPLAIDQAGAYINAGKCSIENYISIFDKYRSKLLNSGRFRGASKYERTVYGTWEVSFQKILQMANDDEDEENAVAAKYAIKLINICAFIHHENISDEIFARAAMYYPIHMEYNNQREKVCFLWGMDTTILNIDEYNNWNEIQYRDSIGILLSFSLIKRTFDHEKFGLHPLVQLWCQDRLELNERKTWIWNARGMLLSSISYKDIHTYQISIIPHIMQNLSHEDMSNTLTSMSNLAHAYDNLGKWTEAEMLGTQVLEMYTRILGKEHPDTLTSMSNLALAYSNVGKWTEAEMMATQVLEVRARILGKEHPDTLTSMSNLALAYSNVGKWTEAEMLGTQVLEMYTRILGKEHPNTLTSMSNLALAYGDLGKWTEAEMMGTQVLEIRARILGKEHPYTLTSMDNLAHAYGNLGKWTEAEMLRTQVLEIRARILGKEHPNTLTSMALNDLLHT